MTPGSFVLLCFLVIWSGPAAAQPAGVNSGAWMLPGCRAALTPSADPDFRQGMCAGSLGTLLFLGDALPDDVKVCRPKGAVLHDAVRIVVEFIDQHPPRQDEPFTILAMEALAAAWPCR
jgi:Rap1a immunity proteins